MQVGEMGYMSLVIDPAGAAVGIWQPLEHKGISARGEVGAPSWFETLSKDYDKACRSTATSSGGTCTRWATPRSSATRRSA